MSSNETNKFSVPEIFQGEIPESFIKLATEKYRLPRRSKAARFLNKLLFNRQLEEVLATDILVRSLYKQALAEEGEEIARHMTEALKVDGLTGLFTRDTFLNVMGEFQTPEGRYRLYIGDIMGLKEINETEDNVGGDRAIQFSAEFWKQIAEKGGGTAGRLGGDELAMIIDTACLPIEQVESMLRNRPEAMSEIALRWCDTPLITGRDIKDHMRGADPKGTSNVKNDRTRSHVELGKTPVVQGAYYISRSGERCQFISVINDETGLERSGEPKKAALLMTEGGEYKVRRLEDFTAERVVKGKAVANFRMIDLPQSEAV